MLSWSEVLSCLHPININWVMQDWRVSVRLRDCRWIFSAVHYLGHKLPWANRKRLKKWHLNFGLLSTRAPFSSLNTLPSRWHIYHRITLIRGKLCCETQRDFLLSGAVQPGSLETAKCAPSFSVRSLIWITQFARQLFVYEPEDTEHGGLVQSDRKKKAKTEYLYLLQKVFQRCGR